MTWAQLGLVGRRVRRGLWAQLWTHVLTSVTMAMALLVFGMFMLLQENLQRLIRGWDEQVQINVYLAKSLDPAEISLLHNKIQNYPEVEGLRHISQEQAWQDFRTSLGSQSNLLEGLPTDVLPASFEISVKRAYRNGGAIEAVADRLRQENGVAAVEYPQEWVSRLGRIIVAVQGLKWTFGGVLCVATFFIVGGVVRLSLLARRDEIEILQWAGAPTRLIQSPFVIEGMIQGIAGAALSVLGLWSLFLVLHHYLTINSMGTVGRLQFVTYESIALIVGIGWLLGASGSLFSVRSFMKTWKK